MNTEIYHLPRVFSGRPWFLQFDFQQFSSFPGPPPHFPPQFFACQRSRSAEKMLKGYGFKGKVKTSFPLGCIALLSDILMSMVNRDTNGSVCRTGTYIGGHHGRGTG